MNKNLLELLPSGVHQNPDNCHSYGPGPSIVLLPLLHIRDLEKYSEMDNGRNRGEDRAER